MLRQYTEELIKGLVDKTEHVNVSIQEGSQTVLIRVSVHKTDIGCVIGKQGRIINAIRTLVQAAAGKLNRRAIVELVE